MTNIIFEEDITCECSEPIGEMQLVCAYHEALFECEDSLANTYEPILCE